MKAGWEIKPLGEVCEVISGQSPKSQFYNEEGIGLPFYQGKKEFKKKYIGKPVKWTSEITREALANDILMSVRAPVGPVNLATQKCCIGRGLAAIRSTELIKREYCFYYLQSKEEELTGNKGAVFNSINKTQIAIIPIPIPPLAEQQQIVAILDKAFAAIDQAKANIEQNIANAEELFQSKLNAIFSQKGEDWEEKTLGEVSKIMYGYTSKVVEDGNTQYVRITDIQNGQIDWNNVPAVQISNKDKGRYSLLDGDIVFARTGATTGKSYLMTNPPNAVFASYLIRVQCDRDIILPSFLYLFFQSGIYWKNVEYGISGSAQGGFNATKLGEMIIYFPIDRNIQDGYVKHIEEIKNIFENIQRIYKDKLNNLEELKKSLLQKAFAGELTSYATKAIDFPLKIENISATDLHCGLIALAYQAHEKANRLNTFHHVKTEKIIHLIESHIGIDLERAPIKDAAGPNDFSRVRKKIEPRAKKAGYFTVKKIGGAYQYSMGNQSEKLIHKVISLLSKEQYKNICHILGMMTKLDTQQAEIVATLYAAWNNLLLSEKEITDENIVFEARENWHKNKLNIERQRFFTALEWMKREENNLIPYGKGKLVAKKT